MCVSNVHLEPFKAPVVSPCALTVLLVRSPFPSEVHFVNRALLEDSVHLGNHPAALAPLDRFKMMPGSLVAKIARLGTLPYLLGKFNALLVNLGTIAV